MDPSHRGVRKAVLPVAGLGTRFLPATKAVPKEMLPVVDMPAIQYVVEEAVNAGLDDILLVTGRGKSAIEDHFDRAPELERRLRDRGETERLAEVVRPTQLGAIHTVRQEEPRGLGHAVACARTHVGDEAFVVMLGDDLIDSRTPVLPEMIAIRERFGGSVLCLEEVPREHVDRYGCAAVEFKAEPGVVDVVGLVEKPDPADAPSNLALVGRYVLDPAVFAILERTPPGRGGEIQLTDALQTLIDLEPAFGGGVRGVVYSGRRYDTGDKLSYLQAVVQLACARADVGPAMRRWLRELVGSLDVEKDRAQVQAGDAPTLGDRS